MSHPELVIFWKRLIRTRLAVTTDVIEHKNIKFKEMKLTPKILQLYPIQF